MRVARLDIEGLKGVIGLGVAGNFAGHLEQAGEASDFKDLKLDDPRAPKGIFPFYVPRAGRPAADGDADAHFLHRFPISPDRIRLASREENHQIEPEVALLCDLVYAPSGEGERVVSVTPRLAMAHNDCSIRREGAKKISEKKNWGADSKGTAREAIPIDRFERGGILDHFRIACFLLRAGTLHEYGADSAVSSYSYIYGQLLAWLVHKLNDQTDTGPLENVARWLEIAGRPAQALISIGATRYTDFGETHFLEPGDVSIVVLYDARTLSAEAVRRIAVGEVPAPEAGISLLRQTVR